MNKNKKIVKIISNDIDLYSALVNTDHFLDVTIDSKLDDIKADTVDILIISDKIISVNELDVYKSILEYTNKILYLCSNTEQFNNIKSLLIAKNIIPVPPLLSNNQITQKILEYVNEEFSQLDNVFVFFGADSKVGTTMIAQSVAEYLAKNLVKKIGLLFLNGQPSLDYVKSNVSVMGLDGIKSKFTNNILSSEELYSSCIQKNNLYILPGTISITEVRYYHPEHINNLINLAFNVFDIVIIDAGCNPHYDIQMGLAALNSTKNRYLVVTQSNKTLKNFERVYNQILAPLDFKHNDFLLIINKYIDSDELYSDIELANIYKTYRATTVPYSDLGLFAEKKCVTLLDFKDHYYINSINQISKIITSQLNISFKSSNTREKSVWFKIKALFTS